MKKNYPPINLGAPGEEISSKDLHAVIQRFKNLNQYRLLSVQNFLQPRQQQFLNLLALIFHQNQALLPGFISTETAAGIMDYSPNKQTIQAARKFSKGYRYSRKVLRHHAIEGIFLMGSVGSIAFSKNSDMDIWLCHSPSLSPAEIDELQKKAEELERWAQSLDLEVHFFLINSEQFRQGRHQPLSSESSGKTQHYLLLEEFYRTAIYIAGKAPAWWIVPPHQEHNHIAYIQHLLDNRFISSREVIDFGSLQSVPAEEFISATLWHIYKSLDSPYKSLLKLFLMECYASEFPHTQWLAQNLKTMIYKGEFEINKLDPYLLIYEKVEEYLNLVASQKRLALSRQCFYLKIIGSSAKALDPKSRIHREEFLNEIALRWQWPEHLLESFGRQKSWDIKKATQEHAVIRDQLKQCLRMILRFAGHHVADQYRNNHDLKLIGRKLHAFLEQKPGKVEIITTRSSIHKKEDELSVVEVDMDHDRPLWHLYAGHGFRNTPPASALLSSAESLLEILSWLVVNKLYQTHLKIQIESHSLKISNNDTQMIVNELHQFLSTWVNSDVQTLEVYNAPNQLLSCLLFINLGEILPVQREDGQIVMSPRSDPLSYGENRLCFIQNVHQLAVSSWGEITHSKYEGLDGFFNCLCDLFNNCLFPISSDQLQVICHTPLRGKSISLRVNTILTQLTKLMSARSPQRYILPGENSFYLFKQNHQTLSYREIKTEESLLQELGGTQPYFSPINFDDYVLGDSFIPFLYTQIRKNTLQVFYHLNENHIDLYVIDEKSAFFTRKHAQCNPQQVLSNYLAFINGLQDHARLPDDIAIKFYEIQENSAGLFSCHPVKVKLQGSFLDLNIRITADFKADNIHQLTIFCNDQEYSAANCRNVMASVRDYILAFRQKAEIYPFHIDEIDVPAHLLGVDNIKQVHTVHYLKFKQTIEVSLIESIQDIDITPQPDK